MTTDIKKVVFCITHPKTGRGVAVDRPQTCTGGKRVPGGVNTPGLGADGPHEKCVTCGESSDKCPGHFGHIKMPGDERFILPAYAKHIPNILSATCDQCGCLLLRTRSEKRDKKTASKLAASLKDIKRLIVDNGNKVSNESWRKLMDIVRTVKTCGVCDSTQPNRYFFGSKTDMYSMFKVDASGVEIKISPNEVYKHLSMIPNEDLFYIGFSYSHPNFMVPDTIFVPPTCIRPSAVSGNQAQRQEDDLSAALVNIVKYCKNLEAIINTTGGSSDKDSRLDDAKLVLNHSIYTFYSLIEARIKGKHGRVRGNLAGKRVDFSARTVISANPDISIDEISVPRNIAQSQMTPETVSLKNKETLQRLIVNGPSNYPGAKQVKKVNGFTFALKDNVQIRERIADSLELGDVVMRHVIDGDIVLVNRQPSLHRMSIMAHRVRVRKTRYDQYCTSNVLGLNPAVTEPYNADFDGDEQNMYFLPGNCQLEIFALAGVKQHIITPKDGSAIIKLVQDGLLGMHLASIEGTTTDRRTFSNLQMFNMNFDLEQHLKTISEKNIETRKLIEAACPSYVDVDTGKFRMKNSIIEHGAVNKAAMSGIIERVFHNDGPSAAVDTINSLQWMMIHWLMERGATMGIKDIVIPKDSRERINDVVTKGMAEIDMIYQDARINGVNNTTMFSNERFLETNAINISSRVLADVESIIEETIDNSNNLKQIISSGAKGKARNLIEICALLGQQITLSDGSRTKYAYNGRTLPHFQKGDDGARSRGFIFGSFSMGLSPQEYAFHQSSGRDGLISTAVKTSETGYSQRKLIKAGENCFVHCDGTVRTSDGSIVSILYGNDGFEGARVVNLTVPQFKNMELIVEMSPVWKKVNTDAIEPLQEDKKYQFAFDVENLVRVSVNKFPSTKDVSAENLMDAYEDCCDMMIASEICDNPNKVGTALFAWWLCPTVLKHHGLVIGKDALDYILKEVRPRYMASIVSPGTAVGVIAAQSIGEPTTQLTLNQFHSSGSGKSTGIVKLTELLSGTHPKQSITTIFFDDDKNSKESVQNIENYIKRHTLRDISTGCEINYDEGNWVLKVEIDRTKVIHLFSGLSEVDPMAVVDIAAKNICETELSGEMTCTTSFMSEDELSLKFMRTKSDNIDDVISSLRVLEDTVLGMVVSGYEEAVGTNIEVVGENKWTLHVKGRVLQHMLCIAGVDVTHTNSDDVIEVFETLGIEAARRMLINQIGDVLEQGVAERHIALMADIMTRTGVVMSVNRHGINRQDGIGPLAKASFEETVDVLITAALRGEVDNMQGVSASIMLGQRPKVGTGFIQTSMNMDSIIEDENEVVEVDDDGSDDGREDDNDDQQRPEPSRDQEEVVAFSERNVLKIAAMPNITFV